MGRCSRCAYSAWVSMGDRREYLCACTYILHRGQRRPCPAGEACTVFLDRDDLPLPEDRVRKNLKEVG